MIQRRIRASDIAVGLPLPWNVYNDKGVLLLAEGGCIQSAEQLARLLDLGLYIEATHIWQQTPETALQKVLHACYLLGVLLRHPPAGGEFESQVLDIAKLIDSAVRADTDVVMATVVLRQGGRYAVHHAVNCACVAAAVMHGMGDKAPAIQSTIAAALTMNLGMLDLQDVLVRQIEPLTPLQQNRINAHPLVGVERLQKLGITDVQWLRAVLEHHEAIDGTGYPHRLRGSQIAAASQILSLADLFCARVSERVWHRPDSAKVVLRDILIERGGHFDAMQSAYFIKTLGVYPIGTVVLLANGDIGVVSRRNLHIDAPWVHTLQAPDGSQYQPPIRRNTDPTETTIVDTLSTADLDVSIDMAAIWGEQARDFRLGHTILALKPIDFLV